MLSIAAAASQNQIRLRQITVAAPREAPQTRPIRTGKHCAELRTSTKTSTHRLPSDTTSVTGCLFRVAAPFSATRLTVQRALKRASSERREVLFCDCPDAHCLRRPRQRKRARIQSAVAEGLSCRTGIELRSQSTSVDSQRVQREPLLALYRRRHERQDQVAPAPVRRAVC